MYAGTRLGLQELGFYSEGGRRALFKTADVERYRVGARRINCSVVIGVDQSVRQCRFGNGDRCRGLGRTVAFVRNQGTIQRMDSRDLGGGSRGVLPSRSKRRDRGSQQQGDMVETPRSRTIAMNAIAPSEQRSGYYQGSRLKGQGGANRFRYCTEQGGIHHVGRFAGLEIKWSVGTGRPRRRIGSAPLWSISAFAQTKVRTAKASAAFARSGARNGVIYGITFTDSRFHEMGTK